MREDNPDLPAGPAMATGGGDSQGGTVAPVDVRCEVPPSCQPAGKEQIEAPALTPSAGGMRELLAIALPMVASHACDSIMSFTDRLFLSRLGPEYMNAAMAGGLSCFMLATFFFGLTGYTTALVAQYLGAGRRERCAVPVVQAVLIVLAAWPLLIAAAPLVHRLFALVSIAPEQLEPQRIYFDIMIQAIGLMLLRNCLSSFFSGIGKTRIVMLAAFTSLVVNVVMNYMLIFGKLGFPAMGIRGAAYGTVLGSASGVLVLIAAYLGPEIRREFRVLAAFRFDRAAMWQLFRFGSPAGIEMLLNVLAFNAVILTFHAHGLATATATTIMFNWDMMSFVPLLGLQVGVTSLVGRYMGAGSPDTAHRAVMSGLKTGWAYSLLVLIVFACFPSALVAMFEPSKPSVAYSEAVPIAVFMIRLAALYVMIDAMVVVLSGALRGAGDTWWAMVISVSLHWVLAPVLFVVLHVLELSPQAAWVTLVATFLLFSGLFYLRYRSGHWRTIRVVTAGA